MLGHNLNEPAILSETVCTCLGDRSGCRALVAVQTKPVLLACQLARDRSRQIPMADQIVNLQKRETKQPVMRDVDFNLSILVAFLSPVLEPLGLINY
eukprot:9412478-Ditylum_brightwellii.AAC.1